MKDFTRSKTGNLIYTGESDLPEAEKRLLAITGGAAPQNNYERKLQTAVKAIVAKGRIVEIPAM